MWCETLWLPTTGKRRIVAAPMTTTYASLPSALVAGTSSKLDRLTNVERARYSLDMIKHRSLDYGSDHHFDHRLGFVYSPNAALKCKVLILRREVGRLRTCLDTLLMSGGKGSRVQISRRPDRTQRSPHEVAALGSVGAFDCHAEVVMVGAWGPILVPRMPTTSRAIHRLQGAAAGSNWPATSSGG